MLTLTPDAASAVRAIVEASELPSEAGGLRIAKDTTEQALTLSLAAVPAQDDKVVDADGARVFLDEPAAQLLDDKVLDAGSDEQGRVQFGIAEAPTA
jgi:iron-sulfur cluster assembly protein